MIVILNAVKNLIFNRYFALLSMTKPKMLLIPKQQGHRSDA